MIKYKNSCCVLRSSNKHLNDEPVAKLKTYGDRAYSVAAQKLWNKSAESDIRLSSSLTVFKTIKSYGTDNQWSMVLYKCIFIFVFINQC